MLTVPNKKDKENKTYMSAQYMFMFMFIQYMFSFRPNISVLINETWPWDKEEKEICL